MTSLLLASTLFVGLAAPVAKVDLTVDVRNGEVLRGERQFRVTVASTHPVTQVEFYVGADLRDNDTSTPYEFRLDTLTEDDGELKLRFRAYTTEGETGERVITVRVDNGLAKGVDHHVAEGLEHIRESRWNEAITSGRIALKIDPQSSAARIVMARANLGRNVLDMAQKFAEDAMREEETVDGLNLLSAIHLQRAFATVGRGAERADVLATVRNAYNAAVDSRRKALDKTLDAMPEPTRETLIPYADAAIRAGRYSLAISTLQPEFERDTRRAEIANRLAFAQMRAGRVPDASRTMTVHRREGELDAYGYALLAVVEADQNRVAQSDDAMREALLTDANHLGVQTAQAYIALRRNRTQTLQQLSTSLARDHGQRSDVNFFLMAVLNRLGQYQDARRAFERAVLAEPTNFDAYIEHGNESITIALTRQLDPKDFQHQVATAQVMYEAALRARPSSPQALAGVAIAHLFQNNPAEAAKMARAAIAASPTYAAGHYTLAAALQAQARATTGDNTRLRTEATAANRRAGELDRLALEGRTVPDAATAFRYFDTGGRTPVMSAPQ
jgi:tetratricopeptide (TPR) repeat protein